jgi:RNA-directed DNA polymerase
MSELRRRGKRPKDKTYPLHQSALYKMGSKARLTKLLGVDMNTLAALTLNNKTYKVYDLPEKVDPFSGKRRKKRTVQEPKPPLRRVQDRLQYLLNAIEVPSYAHAAVKGRSYRTNADVHKGDGMHLATFDIQRFFPSVQRIFVYDFFRSTLLCAPDVARLLTDLCTYGGVLATGSPLSPLLSFFANRSMFEDLSRYAIENDLKFTCYIDDLTFSGRKLPGGLEGKIRSVLKRYRHKLSEKKTCFYLPHAPKHVTGCILYEGKVRVPHTRFKKARAIALAIKASNDDQEILKLHRILNGLLGEAAYLDSRFRIWKERTTKLLRLVERKNILNHGGATARR